MGVPGEHAAAQCVQWVLVFSSFLKTNALTCESSVQLFNVIHPEPPFHVRILSKAAARHLGADSQREGTGSPGAAGSLLWEP